MRVSSIFSDSDMIGVINLSKSSGNITGSSVKS